MYFNGACFGWVCVCVCGVARFYLFFGRIVDYYMPRLLCINKSIHAEQPLPAVQVFPAAQHVHMLQLRKALSVQQHELPAPAPV